MIPAPPEYGLSPARQADAEGVADGGGPQPSTDRPTIGVIRNPRSHRNRGATGGDPAQPGLLIAVPPDRHELARALAGFADAGIDVLIVDGGDGTMRDVLSCGDAVFGDAWPLLMVLPKGKTNALAVDLGMPAKYSLAQALTAIPQARQAVRRPLLLERLDGDHRRIMGFIFGAGAFNAAIDAGQIAHRFGAFQGLAVGLSALAGIASALFGVGGGPWRSLYGVHIRSGAAGEDVARSKHAPPGKRYGLGISTLRTFPLGMRPFAELPGSIRYMLVDAPLRRAVLLIPAILMGLDRPFLKRLGVHRGGVEELAIDLEERFILDGEAFPAGRYALRPGPALTFLVP